MYLDVIIYVPLLLLKAMLEKDAEWRSQHEVLQCEFGNAMRHTLEEKSIENMTRTQLEQVYADNQISNNSPSA